jgi:hypothetical protein
MLLFSIYFLIFLIRDIDCSWIVFIQHTIWFNDLFKKQVYVIGAVRSNSSAMPTGLKKRWMRENCKSRRFQRAQGRNICDCSVERL